MKLFRYIVSAALISLIAGSVLAKDEPDTDKISFRWAFIKKSADKVERVVDFSKKPTVKAGDKIKIYFEPLKNVYIYLYMFDAQKDLMFIFPSKPSFYEKDYKLGEKYILPGKDNWFTIDDSRGTERFYLLASNTRLKNLEDLTKKYQASNKDPELKAKVIEEIKGLGKQNSKLSSPAEKGVSIAGTVVTITRSGEDQGEATEVEGEKFYSKTLRLKHE